MTKDLLRRLQFTNGHASASLVHARDRIFALSNLWSHNRGAGEARAVMEAICEYADGNGLTLILIAQGYGSTIPKALTNDQLVEFYKKFGFEIDPGSRLPYSMTRVPSRKIHAS